MSAVGTRQGAGDTAKVTVPGIREAKGRRRLTMVTAYDFTFARLVDQGGADVLLVGDSLGMVVQGESSTLPVTLEEMVYHTRLVARARPRAMVLGDLPFLSYQTSRRDALESAGQLVKAGAEAVKLEGGRAQAATIRALVRADLPVVGHVGLTPQAIHRMGGHRVQGRDEESRRRVLDDARAVQDAGAFAVVLEGVPLDLAREITAELEIPTIGIGAGPFCDGQVLVMHDLLGLEAADDGRTPARPSPRFVRRYAALGDQVRAAVASFAEDVRGAAFPADRESYHAAGCELRAPALLREIETVAEMQAWSERQRAAGLRVSFVPTMGYLHEGHLSLVREARRRGDRVVVSIFVNPIQFDREEDLVQYPRDPERDRALLREAGVDVLFAPHPREMYPEEFSTRVEVDRLTSHLCGAHRPGHFGGVTTVVSKLFHAVRPHVAVFGEKDYQQLAVVRRMARDLDFGIEIVAGETVREADGLARSSRNARLGVEGRAAARCVPTAIAAARLELARGETVARAVLAALDSSLAHEPRARLEYAVLCDPDSLEPLPPEARIAAPVQLAVAIWVDGVRLIDNARLEPPAAECDGQIPFFPVPASPGAGSHETTPTPLHAGAAKR